MSSGRSEFSIDDAFELSLEEGGPGPGGTTPRFGALHFERKGRGDAEEEGEKQSRLKYQNLENDEDGAQMPPDPDGAMKLRDSGRSSTRSSQWSFSTISNTTQRSYRACCSWTQHPLIQKNRRVVLASFLLLLLGLRERTAQMSNDKRSMEELRGICHSTHPHWNRTPGEPFSRCLQCHLLCSRLPVAHPWSIPRHLHLLCCQRSPRFSVLLLALL